MATTHILVAGAGKSATWLIKYFLDSSRKYSWHITVADGSAATIAEKIGDHPNATAAAIDITSKKERQAIVSKADIVVSLMPPQLHTLLAEDCLQFGKHLITSSYISPEMKALDEAARAKGLMFMCEMGLDPGIDHMTANQIIHSIQRIAGTLTSFKSYCGGLIAPDSDNNPWHYKFSWNPRNIIDAGKAGAAYLEHGHNIQVAYSEMFGARNPVKVDGLGDLAWYPNRDSLKYLDIYEVPDVTTFLRATLRYPEFMLGWQALIGLGLTDTSNPIPEGIKSYAELLGSLNKHEGNNQSLKDAVANKLNLSTDSREIAMISWLGLFDGIDLPKEAKTPGDALLYLLEEKWAMQPDDKDMVVMQHEVEYEHKGRTNTLISSMVLEGENRELSAMAKTVGLPMAILTKLVVTDRVSPIPGVLLPGMPAIYRPILHELQKHGIEFKEVLS